MYTHLHARIRAHVHIECNVCGECTRKFWHVYAHACMHAHVRIMHAWVCTRISYVMCAESDLKNSRMYACTYACVRAREHAPRYTFACMYEHYMHVCVGACNSRCVQVTCLKKSASSSASTRSHECKRLVSDMSLRPYNLCIRVRAHVCYCMNACMYAHKHGHWRNLCVYVCMYGCTCICYV